MMRTSATLVLRRKFSAQHFLNDVIEHECTVFLYSGEICRYLTTLPPCVTDTQHKIRLAIGNGLRPDIWETFQTRFGISEIGEFFASTEGNVVLFNRVMLDLRGQGAVGFLGPFSSSYGAAVIVKHDRDTNELIRDEKGFCIKVRGLFVFSSLFPASNSALPLVLARANGGNARPDIEWPL